MLATRLSNVAAYVTMVLATVATLATAAPPVAKGMKSIGVAIKQAKLVKGVEQTVFEHTLSAGATHGVMTEAWHAGKSSGVNPNLRIRYYVDGEAEASVDYPLFLAHGTGQCRHTLDLSFRNTLSRCSGLKIYVICC